ncbi:serine/threonine-protein kinase [Nonomuraea soli]|uniref:non-specific serine/threonine protein kinase n=1 Tax=Nonomuraea soli TaxID=1032476 RepID=A0A7W0HP27_9ACTN|nr:serine/threonine-protein kinase [Nonomuraea soli]MBA2890425.1 serine/threonine protein kinase [Nonomuraea soli]
MVIDGRFELVERLGSGGMGTVWRARDLALHREVALKEVRTPDSVDSGMVRERVLREARALARIHHPNVVTIHHIVETPEHPWLVMELVQGGSLADRLAHGPLDPVEAARVGRGIVAALRTAHEAGILHRDVKPANVLLRADGSPVLTDFGIAALGDSPGLTGTGEIIGSPEYMAPERLRGIEGEASSDYWSLVLLLYVAVEGRNPFRRDTTMATLAAVLNGRIPPAANAGPLAPVFQAVLQPEPSTRPPAEWIEQQLTAIVSGQATAAPSVLPYTPPQPGGPAFGGPPTPGQGTPVPGPYGAPGAPLYGAPQHGVPQHGAPQHGVPSYVSPVHGAPTAGSPMPGYGAPQYPGPKPYYGDHLAPTQISGRRSKAPAVIVGTVLVAALAAAGLYVLPGLLDGPSTTVTADPTSLTLPSRTPVAVDKPSTEPTEEETTEAPGTLLSPAGMAAVIAALKDERGDTRAYDLTVYPQHISVSVPVKGRKKAYDSLTFRGGLLEPGSSGTWTRGGEPVDLAKVDWKVMIDGFKRADKVLNVDKPTSRYMVMWAEWVFNNRGEPALGFYLSDKYGGGYLATTLTGKVVATHPAEG